MALTRREFLATVAGSAISPMLFAQEQPAADRFPFADLVSAFLSAQGTQATSITPTGLGRASYLPVIDGIARFFAPLQDARGAVIDPYEKAEKQYSTPAFALAAAVLGASGRNRTLLPAAVRAMETASADLAAGRAADGHGDFYTVLLVHADRVLAPLVEPSRAARWRASLKAVAPEKVYRVQPTQDVVNNWNLVAAAGEWLRTREGYGRSMDWVEASIARHLPQFTPSGMYRDPNDPLAYDHFARLWALDLVEEGYQGRHAATLEALLERGAWMSLFMQSPAGELPCGGRSAHHQWNEAQQAVTFETFARRAARRGNRAAAGAFKRGAALSLRSIARWVRPSGELWIVKNRFDPVRRYGYESYSFHSQYNLLAAAMLALAWLRADDQLSEGASPADAGGYGLAVQPAFHKVFAVAADYYVEIDTGADLSYNPTGIVRLHHRDVRAELLSDGVTTESGYHLPAKPTRSMALGPEWQAADGQWHSLAAHGAADLDRARTSMVEASPASVVLAVEYRGRLRGGATVVRERLRITADGVDLEHTVEGPVKAVRQIVPFLANDGQSESKVTLTPVGGEVAREGGRLTVTPGAPRSPNAAAAAAAVRRDDALQPNRNGLVGALVLQGSGNQIACRVAMKP